MTRTPGVAQLGVGLFPVVGDTERRYASHVLAV
jgi:hypothetical protein